MLKNNQQTVAFTRNTKAKPPRENMNKLAGINLPDELRIDSAVRNTDGETNDVFFCKGGFSGHPLSAYIKVNKYPQLSLKNEKDILIRLRNTGIPVPEVIWYGGEGNDILVTEALSGDMIWDDIDPRRKPYNKDKALLYLHAYGECLSQIHSLDITWSPQKRSHLHGFIGEEEVHDERFSRLVAWIRSNKRIPSGNVFVHGDFNVASVLFEDDTVSGVIDWEFAGSGWREYDLAWALRARLSFLNTEAERDALLEGYRKHTTFNDKSLQWCEVLNFLHFAYWNRKNNPEYTSYALDRAMDIAGISERSLF